MIVLDIGIEAGEVEAVGQVVFVDFAEVLVSSRGDELHGHTSSVAEHG